jgi:hypothetical protein
MERLDGAGGESDGEKRSEDRSEGREQKETLSRVGGGLRLRCRGHLSAGKPAIDALSAVSSGQERTNRAVYLVLWLPSLP